jgi:Kef-type K+ transport system membrane component KefB
MSYLPYEQPGITTLLSLTSFLLLLNCIRFLLDRFLYCGLIGEILIGIIWGLPVGGTSWLSSGTQHTIQSLGYLGLISLVFEGGLATDPKQLRKALVVSVSVATVGLLLPIALSFLLLLFPFQSTEGTVYPTPLAGFSAGASLCSTSLGTTFAILSAAGMQTTRTGTVLVGAAMMDDVIGLVMVNIVTTLGKGGNGGWPIARPIVASFGMLLVTLVIAPLVLMPVWMVMVRMHEGKGQDASAEKGKTRTQLSGLLKSIPHLSFMLSTFVSVVYVTIAAFVDASVLFAAFIAGGIVRYLWTAGSKASEAKGENGPAEMYDGYYKPVMEYMLVPFFFVSDATSFQSNSLLLMSA